jgi:hypothetical protein
MKNRNCGISDRDEGTWNQIDIKMDWQNRINICKLNIMWDNAEHIPCLGMYCDSMHIRKCPEILYKTENLRGTNLMPGLWKLFNLPKKEERIGRTNSFGYTSIKDTKKYNNIPLHIALRRNLIQIERNWRKGNHHLPWRKSISILCCINWYICMHNCICTYIICINFVFLLTSCGMLFNMYL